MGTVRNFEAKTVKYAGNRTHTIHSEMFHMLGHCLPELFSIQTMQHSENDARNRRIVGHLIDFVSFTKVRAFSGYNENEQYLIRLIT